MTSYARIFFCFVSLTVFFCRIAGSETLPPTKAEEWPEACNNLKKELGGPELSVIFSEKPKLMLPGQVWVLKWNDMDIPIPAVFYKHIYARKEHAFEGEYSIMLVSSSKEITVSVFAHKDEPMKDAYAEAKDTPEGIEATKTIFGGPVSSSDLLFLGYEKTPGDLTCKKEEWIKEARIAMALVHKSIGSTGLEAVYRNPGNYRSMTAKYREGGTVRYATLTVSSKTPGRMYAVEYRVREGGRYQDFGLIFGDPLAEKPSDPPAWLRALNAALSSCDKKAWKTFLDEAGKAGISGQSVEKSRQELLPSR